DPDGIKRNILVAAVIFNAARGLGSKIQQGADRTRRCLASPPKVFLRVGDKFGSASGRAEVIGPALVGGAMLGVVRIDRHAAYGVDRSVGYRKLMMVILCGHGRALPLIPLGGIKLA